MFVYQLTCSVEWALGVAEAERDHDLTLVGTSEEQSFEDLLLGSEADRVAQAGASSVPLARRHEPAPISWFVRTRKQVVITSCTSRVQGVC